MKRLMVNVVVYGALTATLIAAWVVIGRLVVAALTD